MNVFVTGGSGWIGSATVPELIGAGHAVTGLARSDASAAALEQAGAEVVRGTLDDLDLLRQSAAAADGVLHLAFKHEQAFAGDFETAVTADRAAINTFATALEGTDKPFVIASGLAGQASDRVVTEDDRPDTEGGVAAGRMGNEQLVLGLAGRGVRSASVRLAPTVHGRGDNGFLAFVTATARDKGAAGYVGDGTNHWPAVHRSDAGRLFRLAAESAPAGSVLHGVAEEGVQLRAVAAALGERLGLPTQSVAADDAAAHFGWLAGFLAMDVRASSARTRELLGWAPKGPELLADIEAGAYTD